MASEVENNKLLMRANSENVRSKLKDDPDNPDLWNELGMAVAEEEGLEAAIDIYSEALVLNPFSALLYFGRGRRQIGLRKYIRCIADMTMAIRIEPDSFTHWYYRAIPRYLDKDYEAAAADLRECFKYTTDNEKYPVYVWLFRCYLDSGQRELAEKLLAEVDYSLIPHRMDYGYRREMQLFNGMIKPEELIDLEDLEKNSLIKQEGIDYDSRLRLEIESMTYGLFTYYDYIGDEIKANETLLEIASFEPSAAFGYLAGTATAKERGLI